jgi:hypothetical protein
MAIVGEKRGLFPELKRWVAEGRPVSDTYGFSMLQITLTPPLCRFGALALA